MTQEDASPSHPAHSDKVTFRSTLLHNWFSLSGVIIAGGSLFAFLMLFIIELSIPGSHAYVGILTFLVAPAFLILGLVLAGIGWVRQRRLHLRGKDTGEALVTFDLTRPRDRRNLAILLISGSAFALVSAIGSYHTYHFTESVVFCGQVCHKVMEPEYVTYQHSPHARVACAECHIGSGATWYVKSKLSGLYQVYSTLANKYNRPIETPIENLRPAKETCEQCHWPQKFVGNLDRTYNHFLTDEDSPPYHIRLSLKVGGGDPTHGPVSGIHWHMSVSNRVEYIALDHEKQDIPWVRITDPQGIVTEYAREDFEGEPGAYEIQLMDCMDCHNRPSHIFKSPNQAVDIGIWVGNLDRSLPSVKYNVVDLLSRTYETEEEAMQTIATELNQLYTGNPKLKETIAAVQDIYRRNFFPAMKADWRNYPNNIGHKNWLGCFRCHDGKHATADGAKRLEMNNCNTCHLIMAEGGEGEFEQVSLEGREFRHLDMDYEGFMCNDCHTGAND